MKVDIPSSILILHYQAALLMYSMLHKLTANKRNTGYCFLGEGTFAYLGGAQVQTARPCVLYENGDFCGKNTV